MLRKEFKMKNQKTTLLIAIFLVSMITSLMALPNTNAHTPAWQIPTYAFITVAPDPIGIGQQATIVVWLDKTIIGAAQTNDIRFHNYKVVITAPDETTQTITWETITDTTSSTYTAFTPNQVGTYTFNFSFPGQTYTASGIQFGLTGMINLGDYQNDTYLPSSASTTLTVQEDPVTPPQQYPLPTEYWTRPIEGQNTDWYTVASNWLGSSSTTFNSFACIQPVGSAPNSGHIMWTKPFLFGGVVGGTNVGEDGMTYYSELSYEAQYTNAIILNGRIYYTLPLSNSGGAFMGQTPNSGYACIDLRTGEQIWQNTYPLNPSFGQIADVETRNQHGAIANGYLIASTQTSAFLSTALATSGTWIFYDPLTGNWLFNVTDVPAGEKVYGPNGEYLIYQLDAANGWLAMWNSTQAILQIPGNMMGTEVWRPIGLNVDGNRGWQWNVSISTELNILGSTIRYAYAGDMVLGSGPLLTVLGSQGGGQPYTMWALNLNSSKGTIGNLMWIKTYANPPGNVSHLLGPADPESRVFTFSDKETSAWYGYSLETGDQLWGPTEQNHPAYDYYGNEGGNNIDGYIAYDKLYTAGYGGVIFAYDVKTGNQLWTYGNGGEGNSTNSGLNTVWGRYPIFINAIADGKIFAFTTEHSPNAPAYHGALQRAINATTGEEIWALTSWDSSNAFIADSFLTYLNTYDMQIYTIGKGPSAMTVEAPKAAIDIGKSLIISGTVTDISAGTQQSEQTARFPNGVPAISDKSQSAWMEYIYMQKPRPNDATGVPITLSVVDTNGNYRTIGTTTSDADGFFTYQWKPDIEGQYIVYASFAGSESYWPSHAVTSFAVDPAAATPSPVTTQPPSMADLYFVPGIIGVIVAIVIVGLVLLLVLRKRP